MGKLKKNLANCSPEEFLVQTNKLRHSAERWLKATEVLEIRKNVPKLDIPKDADPDKIKELMDGHRKEVQKTARENFSRILDAVLEEHPKETLELLALLNFVDPENVNDYRVTDYLANLNEIINDRDVMDFFTSLIRLEQTSGLTA
jgi:hypothetical protein